jgi:hypothetical protein
MQTEVLKINLHGAIGQDFIICKRVVETLLKWFSQVVETLIQGFQVFSNSDFGILHIFVTPLGGL